MPEYGTSLLEDGRGRSEELPMSSIGILPVGTAKTRMLIHRVTCIPMFTAALSTTTKSWKEPTFPSTDEWIKRMWFIYTMEYYLAMRKNEITAICNNVDGTGGYHAKRSKSLRERQISYVFTHRWNLRNLTEDHGGGEGEK